MTAVEVHLSDNMGFNLTDEGMLPNSNVLVHVLMTDDRNSELKRKMSHKTQRPPSAMTERPDACTVTGERRCEDGSCIPRVELCPEEQLMNQNTILIMIVVGLAVVVFLVILYCFQQRQRRANRALFVDGTTGLTDNDYDNASLYAPPPSYEDVMNTNLYPPTPQQRRLRPPSADEPMTPPPNYDTALVILAQSQDSVLTKPQRQSSVIRRSVSLEQVNNSSPSDRSSSEETHSNDTSESNNKRRPFLGFFRQFSLGTSSNTQQNQHRSSSLHSNQLRRQSAQLTRQTSQQQQQTQLQRQTSRHSALQRQNSQQHSPKQDSQIIEMNEPQLHCAEDNVA